MPVPYSRCSTTRWTLIFRAAAQDPVVNRQAIEQIVQRYWKPLYSFARQRGMSPEDAEDATQEFLAHLMQDHWLAKADPAKGKFRSFLLNAWKQFLIDQYRKEHRMRRGGNLQKLSLDRIAGEYAYQAVSTRQVSEEHSFLLAWANNVLETTSQRLATEYAQRDAAHLHRSLSPFLTSPIEPSTYQELSCGLGMTSSALRVALHRLRQRFGETLREVVGETVEHPEEIDQELHELWNVLTGGK